MTHTTFTYRHDETVALGERFPSKTVTVESECEDLDAHEMLDLFKDFMVGCGYAEKSFYDACETATQNNPYAESRNRSRFEQTNLPYPYGVKDNTEKTDEIRHSWQNIPTPEEDTYKYPTGM
jgi:hypothetical protein